MHPLTPLYVLGRAFSYKSYFVMAHSLPYSFPRYDHETPDFLHDIVNDKASSEVTQWDLQHGHICIRERVSQHEKLLGNFFWWRCSQRLPHRVLCRKGPWMGKGSSEHLLSDLWSGPICLDNFENSIEGQEKKETKYMRKLTFQLESSNKYMRHGREMDSPLETKMTSPIWTSGDNTFFSITVTPRVKNILHKELTFFFSFQKCLFSCINLSPYNSARHE